jgi:putative spermidine/putrescine transport system permease protein
VLFLYGPMIAILVLSFQGPNGGMTFPMNGVSLHWFGTICGPASASSNVVDALISSLKLGLVVTLVTVVISVMAGYAFRRSSRAQNLLFFAAIASLIVPSIVVSLGIALEFQLFNQTITGFGDYLVENYVDIGANNVDELPRDTPDPGQFPDPDGPVHLRSRRPSDLDATLRPPDHVRRLQPLQSGL